MRPILAVKAGVGLALDYNLGKPLAPPAGLR